MSEENQLVEKSRAREISGKMAAGLTREQAIDVISRQAEHDEQLVRQSKKTGK